MEKLEILKNLNLHKRGKVRDIYEFDGDIIIVATDRISAFDYVLPDNIPDKGKILTQLSLFWFNFLEDIIENHLIDTTSNKYSDAVRELGDDFEYRSMLAKKTEVIPFECVARGYIEGSGWKDYKKTGSICGIKLPPGLKRGDKLPETIFTPATKAETGHDINIDFDHMADKVGKESAELLKDTTLKLYKRAAEFALEKGIIIADTKFEFGYYNDDIILIDEVLTPDSSRFWPRELYKPGEQQVSFDKQFVRDYLEKIKWDKKPPIPGLPDDIIEKTRQKYIEAYKKITGKIPSFAKNL